MPIDDNKINSKFNIKEMIFAALGRWYIFCIVIAVCFVGALIYSHLIVTPLYDSSGKIYIMNKNSQTINTSDLSVSSYLTRDYENLIMDRAVLSEVSQNLDYKYSYAQLKGAVTVVNPDNTRFIEITVRTASAKDSKKIVDTICQVSQEKITELLGIDRVTIVREGNLARSPSVPNISKNLFNSLMFGIFVSVIIFCAMYFLNDKINTPEDVEKYLELSVLGNIPYNQGRTKSK